LRPHSLLSLAAHTGVAIFSKTGFTRRYVHNLELRLSAVATRPFTRAQPEGKLIFGCTLVDAYDKDEVRAIVSRQALALRHCGPYHAGSSFSGTLFIMNLPRTGLIAFICLLPRV